MRLVDAIPYSRPMEEDAAREKVLEARENSLAFPYFSSTIEGTSTRKVDDDLNLRNLVVDS